MKSRKSKRPKRSNITKRSIISKTSKRRSKKRSKKTHKPKNMTCKEFLKYKIKINMKEFKNPKQAVAISYSQVRKSNPRCKRFL